MTSLLKNRTRVILFFLAAIGIFILAHRQLTIKSHDITFHGDEYHFINRSVTLEYFINRKFDQPFWQGEATIGPRLPEYLWGAALWLNKGNIIGYLRESGFTDDNLCCSRVDGWQLNITREHSGRMAEIPDSLKKGLIPVIQARKLATLISAGIIMMVFMVGYFISGYFMGILSAYLIFNHNLFPLTLRTMGDGPLMFFLILNLLMSLLFVNFSGSRKRTVQNITFLLFFISAGLTMSTKIMNGMISAAYASTLVLSENLQKKHGIFRCFMHIMTGLGISLGLFILLHPYLWKHPIYELINTVNYYQKIVVGSMYERFPGDVLGTIPQRISIVYTRIFSAEGVYRVMNIFGLPDYLPLDAILASLGLFTMVASGIRNSGKHRKNVQALFLWVAITFSSITLNIPLDWDRYYLPLVLSATLTEAYFVSFLLLWIARLIKKMYSELSAKALFTHSQISR